MNLFDSYPIRCHLRRVAADQMERGALCDLNEEPRPSFSGCAAAKMFENCMEAWKIEQIFASHESSEYSLLIRV